MNNYPANAGRTPTGPAGSANDDQWKKRYIYRIPDYMKAQNPGSYSPLLVSIGPYHQGERHLQAMEEHKARSLERFLSASVSSMEECCKVLESKFEKLISSYQPRDYGFQPRAPIGEFTRLMVKDGVFLYEFMRGYPDGVGWENYDEQDPVFSVRALRNIPNIVADILMLENQLPITVLERLIAFKTNQLNDSHHEEVNKLVLKFLSAKPPSSANMTQPLGLHVLDISRKVLAPLPSPSAHIQTGRAKEPPYETNIGVKSAINLYDVGVKFRENEIPSFDIGGTLSLPPLTFDTTTEAHFLNAIAFECLHPATNNEVRSYIAFLQGLIASPSDVAFLSSKNLIESKIGDDQAVYRLMKTISRNVFFDPSSNLCVLRDDLNAYYIDNMGKWRRRRREWWRALHQSYLKNPWTIIAIIYATAIYLIWGNGDEDGVNGEAPCSRVT